MGNGQGNFVGKDKGQRPKLEVKILDPVAGGKIESMGLTPPCGMANLNE